MFGLGCFQREIRLAFELQRQGESCPQKHSPGRLGRQWQFSSGCLRSTRLRRQLGPLPERGSRGSRAQACRPDDRLSTEGDKQAADAELLEGGPHLGALGSES